MFDFFAVLRSVETVDLQTHGSHGVLISRASLCVGLEDTHAYVGYGM